MWRILLLGSLVLPRASWYTAEAVRRSPLPDGRTAAYLAGRVTVGYEPQALSLLRSLGLRILKEVPELRLAVLEVPPDTEETWIRRLEELPGIRYAAPEALYALASTFPNDPYLSNQQTFLNQMQVFDAWDVTTGSPDMAAAIIDSGVSRTHEDLQSRILGGYDFVDDDPEPWEEPGDGQDNDGNGFVDENVGHGTTVAGVLAADTNNQKGIAALTWQGGLLVFRVFPPDGSAPASTIAEAVFRAAQDPRVRVINLSLSGPTDHPALREAVQAATAAGILVVAAAGNQSSDAPVYPASYPEVIAVAAVDENDRKAGFSNYGDWVDISAPGTGIYTTTFTRTGLNRYGFVSGTSIAAPLVSGTLLLLWSAHPDWTAAQVRSHLLTTTDPLDNQNPDYAGLLGSGRVNAYNAVFLQDFQPPRLENARPVAINQVLLRFTEPMSAPPAEPCTLDPAAQIYAIQPTSSAQEFLLLTEPLRAGVQYTVTCGSWPDLAGNPLPSESLTFLATDQEENLLHRRFGVGVYLRGQPLVSLNDGDLRTGAPAQVLDTLDIVFPQEITLESVILRYEGEPWFVRIAGGPHERLLRPLAEGSLWGTVELQFPATRIRHLRLTFPEPSVGTLYELESYRTDRQPPRVLSGPDFTFLPGEQLQVSLTASEPVYATVFWRPGLESWRQAVSSSPAETPTLVLAPVAVGVPVSLYWRLEDLAGNGTFYPDVPGGEAPLVIVNEANYALEHSPPGFVVQDLSVPLFFRITPDPGGLLLVLEDTELPLQGQNGEYGIYLDPEFLPQGFLRYQVRVPNTGILLPATAFRVPVRPYGDINGDGLINEYDALDLLLAWQETLAERPELWVADLNQDLVIDGQDLAIWQTLW